MMSPAESADFSLVNRFEPDTWKDHGAHHWDRVRAEVPAWRALTYQWIAGTHLGDQIILTTTSPLHAGAAIYLHGPNAAGPRTDVDGWLDTIIYLGSSVAAWHARIDRYGDEYAIAPALIDRLVAQPERLKATYRILNPGLPW